MLSERQEKILQLLVEEYLDSAKPVSSDLLKKRSALDISPATVRNDLQELANLGYVKQPHTSAGRIPTEKAYHFFAIRIKIQHEPRVEDFVEEQIREARKQIEEEMQRMEQFMQTLENDNFFEILKILDTWHKRITE